MANVIRCDRCGAIGYPDEKLWHEIKEILPSILGMQVVNNKEPLHLCPTCSRKLIRWITRDFGKDN